MTTQFRFRGNGWHEPSQTWYVTEWCQWTDIPPIHNFTVGGAADFQFRERPAPGVIPDFCPCGYMDKGTCGPDGCPKRAQQKGSAP